MTENRKPYFYSASLTSSDGDKLEVIVVADSFHDAVDRLSRCYVTWDICRVSADYRSLIELER